MFHYSCSFPAWLCSSATLISQSSTWCCHGLAFARPCTEASRSSQSFVMIAHITPHSHCQYGTLLLEFHLSYFGRFGGSLI
ncbi:hypothetical protein BJY52DRAFT_1283593 [Lactarius psammicola]|nr:hypothetical protein BJY52DRAFT_1283593 [Lactarius psammicola]